MKKIIPVTPAGGFLCLIVISFILLAAGCGKVETPATTIKKPVAVASSKPAPPPVADVDGARIIAADPANWLSHGRTYDEQRYSPLKQINDNTISDLGLAWYVGLETRRGVEVTPLVVDGSGMTSTWILSK